MVCICCLLIFDSFADKIHCSYMVLEGSSIVNLYL